MYMYAYICLYDGVCVYIYMMGRVRRVRYTRVRVSASFLCVCVYVEGNG